VPDFTTVSFGQPLRHLDNSSVPVFNIAAHGGMIRYFVDRQASVAVEVLGANGRAIVRIPSAPRAQGWHSIQLPGASATGVVGNGVYIVRCVADGQCSIAKRIVVVQ
jgi:hypothetical protein